MIKKKLKKCSQCGERKANIEFWEDRSTRDGCTDECRWCCAGQPTPLQEAKNEVGRIKARIKQVESDIINKQKILRRYKVKLSTALLKIK